MMSPFKNIDYRTMLAYKNIAASLFLRVFTGIITLILVPLTLKCLGEYSNGVWLTISSMLLWIENFDVGLGNGLRNKLCAYVAGDNWSDAQKAVSTTLILLILIMIPIMIVLALSIYFCDVYSFLNISPEKISDLKNILYIGVVLFCSTFVLKLIGNVYMGMQLPAVSNFLITAGHPIILAGTYYMYVNGIHSLFYITFLNLGTPLMIYLFAYPYTFFVRYPQLRPSLKFFDRSMIRELFSLGFLFFINQITGSIVLLSSNILISKWFSPAWVTPYQIAFRYFSIITLLFLLISSPLWSATTDAYERGEMGWIKNAIRKVDKMLYLFFLAIILMVAVSDFAYDIWIGDATVIPLSMTVSMAVYDIFLITSLAYCYILNGMGKLRLQLYCTITGIILYAIAAPLLTYFINNPSAIAISISIALLPNVVCNSIQVRKIVNGTAKGIWLK